VAVVDILHHAGSLQPLGTYIPPCPIQKFSAAVHRVSPRTLCVHGTTGFDGLERISTLRCWMFGVERRKRTAGAYRHLATLMAEIGWSAVRVRDFNRRGYKEQVRGYVRNARAVQ
jgi:hypothetical protein